MDLTKIDKPFGELDEATQGALLLAHHRGGVIEYWDFEWISVTEPMWSRLVIYRVQPKTVIGEVVFVGADAVYYSMHPLPSRTYDDMNTRLTFTFPTRDGMHVPGIYTSPEGMQIKIEVAK